MTSFETNDAYGRSSTGLAGTGQALEEAPRRAQAADGRSVPALLKELSGEVAELVRLEMQLARTEMSEKAEVYQKSTIRMVIGATVLLAALLALLWAVNMGLTALLAQYVAEEVAVWLSPLVLAVLFGIIGWAMVQSGKRRMAREGIAPDTVRRSLQDDRTWAQEKARQVRQELREVRSHG
ncbi:MAG TPA: phage holin family protein [Longimicrobiales bacterium]|nr:phage holin family protein [Longimicrobiales bacterium]